MQVRLKCGRLSIFKGSASKEQIHIGPNAVIVGRNSVCDLAMNDRKVSSAHLEVVATPRGVRVRDLDSTNGTRIGDTLISEVFLTRRTIICIGHSMLEFKPDAAIEADVSSYSSLSSLMGKDWLDKLKQPFKFAKQDVLNRLSLEYFTALYAECKGNISEMSRQSGIRRAHVRSHLRRHNIS